jgi:PleD family two-component response regulator
MSTSSNEPKHRILILSEPDGANVLQQALGGVYQLEVAKTEEDALARLEKEPFELIISKVFFEYADPFHFLRTVRSNPKTQRLPFLCFAARQSEVARQFKSPLQKSFSALGAQGYLSLDEYCDEVKCDYDRLRKDVAAHLS